MKKRTLITQKQIAEQAGVSQTVVSLALSNSYDITLSEETRQRVLEVAKGLGYVPHVAAKALVKGRSSNLGFILIRPHYQVFRDPYIPNVITGLSAVVRTHGFRLLVEHIDNLNQINTISNMLKGGEVAGIVLSSFYGLEHIIMPLIEDGYPIILLDTPPDKNYGVLIDHASGVRSAAAHILSLGHRRIGCILFGPPNPHINNRLNAFLEPIKAAGGVIDETLIRHGNYDPESGYEVMQSLLQLHPMPTAVFGMNDFMAAGAMRAIHEAGLRIPEDIAVVGYDDMRFAAFTHPTLTTVRAPEVEQGRMAGELLIKLIGGEPLPEQQMVLGTELIIRNSCGARLNL
jgi:LacI family transcriptional regulator